ncbi:GNAT family N-acetyltransferase [Litoribrevibacter albus]|uniref:N-acetyltransferase n=1 Tax=Litoribrevibacter albus TaxID=1473156 RepID=A0AA37SBS0_9GAMM|nr:GNAT family N-acetyltransferase [Litoribrevibacter albus]GLQ31759.1 N-acetyltransferase [Litoribrevibacter albus]
MDKAQKLQIKQIIPEYDTIVCNIIQQVGREFGAVGEGFGPSDDEVKAMSQHYRPENRSAYFVAEVNGQIVGGSGIAAFSTRDDQKDICELKKLFILPEGRGLGLGRKLTEQCLEFAKVQGYQQCYLDTLSNMTAAITLYEKMGFEHLSQPLDGTIHGGCDVWMMRGL